MDSLFITVTGFGGCTSKHSIDMERPTGYPSGLAWSLYKCAALLRAVYGVPTTDRPLGTIGEEKGISSRFQVSISSKYDLSC